MEGTVYNRGVWLQADTERRSVMRFMANLHANLSELIEAVGKQMG